MEQIAEKITEGLIQELPEQSNFFTSEDLLSSGIPAFIVKTLERTVANKIGANMNLPQSEWVQTDASKVQAAWLNFVDVSKVYVKIPSSKLKGLLLNAVESCLKLALQPRQSVPEFIFKKPDVIDFDTLKIRVSNLYVNQPLGVALLRYMEKKGIEELELEVARDIVRKIDQKLCENYHPLNWVQVLKPVFQLAGPMVDSDLFRLFFQDKGRSRVARKFDLLDKEISETEFVEIMSSAELLDIEGYEDTQPHLFMQEAVEPKREAPAPSSIEKDETDVEPDYKPDKYSPIEEEGAAEEPLEETEEELGESSGLQTGVEKTVNEEEEDDELEAEEENIADMYTGFESRRENDNEPVVEWDEEKDAEPEKIPDKYNSAEPEEPLEETEEERGESSALQTGVEKPVEEEENDELETEEENLADMYSGIESRLEIDNEPVVDWNDETDAEFEKIPDKYTSADPEEEGAAEEPLEETEEELGESSVLQTGVGKSVEEEEDNELEAEEENLADMYSGIKSRREIDNEPFVDWDDETDNELSLVQPEEGPDSGEDSVILLHKFMFDEGESDEDGDEPEKEQSESQKKQEPSSIYQEMNLVQGNQNQEERTPDTLDDFGEETVEETGEMASEPYEDLSYKINEQESETTEEDEGERTHSEQDTEMTAKGEGEDELPMWRSFLERDDIETESGYEYDEDSEEETEAEDDFNEEPIYDLTAEEEDPQEKLNDVGKWLNDEKDLFVAEIFRNSEIAYEQALIDILEFDDWKSASHYLEREVFSRNRIDVYDEAAVDFTDRLHSYFMENKS